MKTIGIPFPIPSLGQRRLLNTLGEIFNINFLEISVGRKNSVDAWLLQGVDWGTITRITDSRIPCYVIPRESHISAEASMSVEFTDNKVLDPVLRNRRLITDEAVGVKYLPREIGDISVLASTNGMPIWAVENYIVRIIHYTSLLIPEMKKD